MAAGPRVPGTCAGHSEGDLGPLPQLSALARPLREALRDETTSPAAQVSARRLAEVFDRAEAFRSGTLALVNGERVSAGEMGAPEAWGVLAGVALQQGATDATALTRYASTLNTVAAGAVPGVDESQDLTLFLEELADQAHRAFLASLRPSNYCLRT